MMALSVSIVAADVKNAVANHQNNDGGLIIMLLPRTGILMGWCIQRAGPRMCTMLGGLIATAGVLSSSFVSNLALLYLTFGGLNGECICNVCIC